MTTKDFKEEFLTIPWVKENEKMIDFTITQEEWEAQEEECLSDTEDDTEEVCCVGCNTKVCGYDEEPPHKDSRDEAVCNDCWEEVCEPSMRLVNCDFCGKEEDPDEIIKGTEGDACGECRHLCDKVELTE